MAILTTNPLINGFSGMLGNSIVFRNLRGKTVLSSRPCPPKKQSDQQKANRNKFREASMWARNILKSDPEMKTYYLKRAKKLKLPNAYTAAIADYMRSPKVLEISRRDGEITCCASKKDFRLKKTEVQVRDEAGTLIETQTVSANVYGECIMVLPEYPPKYSFTWLITDEANNVNLLVFSSQ